MQPLLVSAKAINAAILPLSLLVSVNQGIARGLDELVVMAAGIAPETRDVAKEATSLSKDSSIKSICNSLDLDKTKLISKTEKKNGNNLIKSSLQKNALESLLEESSEAWQAQNFQLAKLKAQSAEKIASEKQNWILLCQAKLLLAAIYSAAYSDLVKFNPVSAQEDVARLIYWINTQKQKSAENSAAQIYLGEFLAKLYLAIRDEKSASNELEKIGPLAVEKLGYENPDSLNIAIMLSAIEIKKPNNRETAIQALTQINRQLEKKGFPGWEGYMWATALILKDYIPYGSLAPVLQFLISNSKNDVIKNSAMNTLNTESVINSQSNKGIGIDLMNKYAKFNWDYTLHKLALLPYEEQLMEIDRSVAIQIPTRVGPDTSSLLDWDLSRKTLLLDVRKERNRIIKESSDRYIRLLRNRLYKLKATLSGMAPQDIGYQKIIDKFRDVEVAIYQALPKLEITPEKLSAVKASLQKDEYVIDFLMVSVDNKEAGLQDAKGNAEGHTNLYAAAIFDKNGEESLEILGLKSRVDEFISEALSANENFKNESLPYLARLRELLFGKIANKLKNVKALYILADPGLARIPFASLPRLDSRGEIISTVGSEVDIRILNSIKDLNNPVDAFAPRKPASIIANPQLSKISTSISIGRSSASQGKWQELPGTQLEAELLAKIIRPHRLYTRDRVNRESILTAGPAPVLHIATHSFVGEEGMTSAQVGETHQLKSLQQPSLMAGLILSGANDYRSKYHNPSVLKSDEIEEANLDGIDMVVLSSCTSGNGTPISGLGLMGFRTSLSVAGAKSSLLSLWKVDDESTAFFMSRFYEYLKLGKPRNIALALTQFDFWKKRTGNHDWSHPYYWAAWQLVGDWRPIKGL